MVRVQGAHMAVLPRTQEDDVIPEAKLREHPLVIPRAALV
jgi:hypothetical protein